MNHKFDEIWILELRKMPPKTTIYFRLKDEQES